LSQGEANRARFDQFSEWKQYNATRKIYENSCQETKQCEKKSEEDVECPDGMGRSPYSR
jgi:hypothetical protein